MCVGEVCIVQEKLQEVQKFLEPLKPLVNAHMTGFITQNCWNLLPDDIREEALTLSTADMHEIFWNWGSNPENFSHSSSIGDFLNNCWSFSLASHSFDNLKLGHKLDDNIIKGPSKCMSPKKHHEISNLKEVVAYLCESSKSNCVVDVGGGKGYLGASLVLEKNISVLSIDSKSGNTEGAGHVFQRIEKDARTLDDTTSSYKRATAFVTPETDLRLFTSNYFGAIPEYKICLTGLHVCGDLASTCLKLFCNSHVVFSMCCVGCCYNLLTEMFEEKQSSETSTDQFGFPLSDFLKKQHYHLGRNARMIACQSLDRICSEKRVMKPNLHWRAVLQVHLERLFGPNCDLSVGRRCSKANNLSDYLLKAEKSLGKNLELTEENIKNLTQETRASFDTMAKFYCFRLALAPVVETLLILDKLLFLHEQGVENAYVCKLFDGIESPRCFGIIALRTMKPTLSNSSCEASRNME